MSKSLMAEIKETEQLLEEYYELNEGLLAKVEELKWNYEAACATLETRDKEIEELEERVEEYYKLNEKLIAKVEDLEAIHPYHHPDCNWWKWDWRYSWDVTDCNCDKVAALKETDDE